MLAKLLLLFIVVPAVELILLIEIGQVIGTIPTLALIVFTGALGAFLVRRQGVQVLAKVRSEMQSGQLPADSIFDGVILLVAGAFLMTPGILTDVLGFLCLIPFSRRVMKNLIWTRIKQGFHNGQIMTETFQGTPRHYEPEDVIILDQDDFR